MSQSNPKGTTKGTTKGNINAILDKYKLRTVKTTNLDIPSTQKDTAKLTKTLDKKTNFAIDSGKTIIVNKTEKPTHIHIKPISEPITVSNKQISQQIQLLQPVNNVQNVQTVQKRLEPNKLPDKPSVNDILKRDKEQVNRLKTTIPVAIIPKGNTNSPDIFKFIPKVKPDIQHQQHQHHQQQSHTQHNQPQIKTLTINGNLPTNTPPSIKPIKQDNPLNFIPIRKTPETFSQIVTSNTSNISKQQLQQQQLHQPQQQQQQKQPQQQLKRIIIDSKLNDKQSQTFKGNIDSSQTSQSSQSSLNTPMRKTPTNLPVLSHIKPLLSNNSFLDVKGDETLKMLHEKYNLILKQQKEEIDKIKFQKEQMVKLHNRKKEIALMKSIQIEQAKLQMLHQKQFAINKLIQNPNREAFTGELPKHITHKSSDIQPMQKRTLKIHQHQRQQTLQHQQHQQHPLHPLKQLSSYDKINALNSTESFKVKVKPDKTDKTSTVATIATTTASITPAKSTINNVDAIILPTDKQNLKSEKLENPETTSKLNKSHKTPISQIDNSDYKSKLKYYSKDDFPNLNWGNSKTLYDFHTFTNHITFVNGVCKFFANSEQESQYLKTTLNTSEKMQLLKTTYGFKHLDKLIKTKTGKTTVTDETDETDETTHNKSTKPTKPTKQPDKWVDIIDYLYKILLFDDMPDIEIVEIDRIQLKKSST